MSYQEEILTKLENIKDNLESVSGNDGIVHSLEEIKIILESFPTETEFNLITGIATSGTTVSLIDETNNFEEDALIDSWVKFEIDGIKYNRKIISNFTHQINWLIPTREDIGASATIGSGVLGEGQIVISVAEGTGSNYSVEFVAGTGQSSAARADYADGVLTMVSPTDIDSNPTGIMPGNLQGIIEANAEAGAIFTSQIIVSGVALPITFAETLIGADDEITIGSGLPNEGLIVVNCIDSLLGEVGNAYSIEIVQGEATTGDVIASINENTKVITITVNLNGDSEPIALMAGTLATLIGNDPVFTDKLSPDINTLVSGQIFYTDTPIFFEGGLNSIPVPANTEYSVVDIFEDNISELIGEVTTNPTANTLLARMKSIEDKIDAITDGTTPAVMSLSGSIVEYAWFTGATKPTPTEDFAWGIEFNASTGAIKTHGWSGIAWVEVV